MYRPKRDLAMFQAIVDICGYALPTFFKQLFQSTLSQRAVIIVIRIEIFALMYHKNVFIAKNTFNTHLGVALFFVRAL